MFARNRLFIALPVFFVACVFDAPASLFTLALPPQIQIKNVQGTIWNGRASALGVGTIVVQEHVEWRLNPLAMLTGRMEWLLTGWYGKRSSTLSVRMGVDGMALQNVNIYLPLEPFAALHSRLNSLGLGATLHASAQRLGVQQRSRATLDVDGLFFVQLPQSGQLGSYQLELDADESGSGKWGLRSLSGIVAATGHGTFSTKRFQFNGQLTLNPHSPLPGLSAVLSRQPGNDAGYQVSF